MSEDRTLDPADWEAFRRLAHRMVDDTVDHLSSLRDQPAWRPMPDGVRQGFSGPVPYEGIGEEAAYEAFAETIRPYPNGNLHPRFFGWVQGNGTPLGMMADMLAASINPHMAGFDQAPALVEAQVVDWLRELMGFPEGSSGVLCLGGTMANLLGLAVARHARAGFDVRAQGVGGADLVIYGSSEVHSWLKKAAELMGMGRRALHILPAGPDHRLDPAALAAAIRADRRAGRQPLCVVASAGTVNTGAVDDLTSLSALTRQEGLWLHVDGAFGALARLSPHTQDKVRGIEGVDSLAFDLHKWMYQPFDVACVLVRDSGAHRAAFAADASYLTAFDRGVIRGGLPFANLGMDLTRSFRALKVWMGLKAHGARAFGDLIAQNVAQAEALAERIQGDPELELLAPVTLNVVCFRVTPRGADPEGLDALNQEVLLRMQERGIAVPSSTVLGGRFALRCCFVNHRTRQEDVAAVAQAAVALGREILAEGG